LLRELVKHITGSIYIRCIEGVTDGTKSRLIWIPCAGAKPTLSCIIFCIGLEEVPKIGRSGTIVVVSMVY